MEIIDLSKKNLSSNRLKSGKKKRPTELTFLSSERTKIICKPWAVLIKKKKGWRGKRREKGMTSYKVSGLQRGGPGGHQLRVAPEESGMYTGQWSRRRPWLRGGGEGGVLIPQTLLQLEGMMLNLEFVASRKHTTALRASWVIFSHFTLSFHFKKLSHLLKWSIAEDVIQWLYALRFSMKQSSLLYSVSSIIRHFLCLGFLFFACLIQ